MTSRWMNLKRSGPRSPTFDAELRWPRLEPKKGNACIEAQAVALRALSG